MFDLSLLRVGLLKAQLWEILSHLNRKRNASGFGISFMLLFFSQNYAGNEYITLAKSVGEIWWTSQQRTDWDWDFEPNSWDVYACVIWLTLYPVYIRVSYPNGWWKPNWHLWCWDTLQFLALVFWTHGGKVQQGLITISHHFIGYTFTFGFSW